MSSGMGKAMFPLYEKIQSWKIIIKKIVATPKHVSDGAVNTTSNTLYIP